MKVYLAGPMSIMPEDFNFPVFHSASKFLRETMGWEVFSPAEADIERYGTDDIEVIREKANYRDCLRVDLNWIIDNAQGIAMLPGWEKSKGVAAELALAKALKLPVYTLSEMGDTWILQEKAY